MNRKAYKDGIESVRDPKNVRIRVIERAIRDCRAMGWSYLESYFQGKRDMAQAARGIERAAQRLAEMRG